METVSRVEADFWEQFEAFQFVSVDLARFRDLDEVAERALELALELTRSSVAFIALVDDTGDRKQVYTRAANPADAPTEDQIDSLVENSGPTRASMDGQDGVPRRVETPQGTFFSQALQAGGRMIGMIGVVNGRRLKSSHKPGVCTSDVRRWSTPSSTCGRSSIEARRSAC